MLVYRLPFNENSWRTEQAIAFLTLVEHTWGTPTVRHATQAYGRGAHHLWTDLTLEIEETGDVWYAVSRTGELWLSLNAPVRGEEDPDFRPHACYYPEQARPNGLAPGVEEAIQRLWNLPTPHDGELDRVLEVLAFVRLKDGRFALQDLSDPEPFFSTRSSQHEFLQLLDYTKEFLEGWIEHYYANPLELADIEQPRRTFHLPR